jgi:hypothetical protein
MSPWNQRRSISNDMVRYLILAGAKCQKRVFPGEQENPLKVKRVEELRSGPSPQLARTEEAENRVEVEVEAFLKSFLRDEVEAEDNFAGEAVRQ